MSGKEKEKLIFNLIKFPEMRFFDVFAKCDLRICIQFTKYVKLRWNFNLILCGERNENAQNSINFVMYF